MDISRREALHLLGYRRKDAVPPSNVERLLDRELKIGRELLRFKGIYRKCDAVVGDDTVIAGGEYRIRSRRFASWITGCGEIYLFVVTAGQLFSERVQELLELEDTSGALAADAVGSSAAECAARAADEYLRSLEPDCRMTKRYSPGYGDWNITDNRSLLEFIDAGDIGITVNEGGLMLPEKSVSAAKGIFRL